MTITTTYGDMDERHLVKKVVPQPNSDQAQNIVAIEYYLGPELVHRSLEAELIGRDLTPVQQPIV